SDADPLDAPVSIAVAASAGLEGGGDLAFDVSLSRDSLQSVTVYWATAPGSATPGIDYVSASGSLTFPPGVTSESADVTLLPDHLLELPEWLALLLSSPGHAVLANNSALGTILDDDSPRNELVQGSERLGTLAAWPGPEEHRDYYVLGAPGHSSW